MKPTTIVLTIAALVLATVPAAQADPEADCNAAIAATQAEWDTHPDGLPADVAATGFQNVYAACYVPAAPVVVGPEPARAEPVEVDSEPREVCAGWGKTPLWRDQVVLLGKHYRLVNMGASGEASKWAFPAGDDDEDNPDFYMDEGTLTSPLDEMKVVIDGKFSGEPVTKTTWQFATVPMSGIVGLNGEKCWFTFMPGSHWSAQGMPAGTEIIRFPRPILEVAASGTLCALCW